MEMAGLKQDVNVGRASPDFGGNYAIIKRPSGDMAGFQATFYSLTLKWLQSREQTVC